MTPLNKNINTLQSSLFDDILMISIISVSGLAIFYLIITYADFILRYRVPFGAIAIVGFVCSIGAWILPGSDKEEETA